jgi:putative tricarboxylic transport membrane protein
VDQFLGFMGGGLSELVHPTFWVAIVIGTIFGVIVGALPGLGTTLGYALILPFTYNLEIETTISLLISLTVGVSYGNSIPAILVGVPGTPAAVLTVLDGYRLHKMGKTGLALGVAFIAALGGQTVSAIFFAAAIVPLAALAFHFLQPELFSLYLMGIVAIVSLTGRNAVKGIIAAALGFLVAMIGLDPVTFQPRFTFDSFMLRSGLEASAIVIGLLAVSELLRQTRQVFQWDVGEGKTQDARFPKFRDYKPALPAMFGGTVVGTVVGAIPGAGATPAALISYQQAQAISKEPEKFGKGSIEGIGANEAAQNASNSGELIPALALGLPTSGSMVLLLAALTMNGFVPGPTLVTDAPELVWAVIGGLLGSTLFLLITGWPMCKFMLKLLTVDRTVVIVGALFMVIVGVFSLSYRFLDVLVCLLAGIVGYFMLRYGYSVAAASLAVILAAGFEATLRRGLALHDNSVVDFAVRPIAGPILIIALVFFVIGVRRTIITARAQRTLDREGEAVATTPAEE